MVYLACSFATEDWKMSWIVWPMSGVLYGAVQAVLGVVLGRQAD